MSSTFFQQGEFVECEKCRCKPGMPILCETCLHNRKVIYDLQSKCDQQKYKIQGMQLKEQRLEKCDKQNRKIAFFVYTLFLLSSILAAYLTGRKHAIEEHAHEHTASEIRQDID